MIPKNFLARATIAFPRAAAVFNLFVILLQIRTVPLRDQSTLDQSRPSEFRATFRDAPTVFRLIRVGNAWDDPEVRCQVAFLGEIVNIANDGFGTHQK
jgi:hypothetical protein